MAKKKKKNRVRQESSSSDKLNEQTNPQGSSNQEGELFERLNEPLFIFPILVFLVTITNSLVTTQRELIGPGSPLISLLIGISSLYFLWGHIKNKTYRPIHIAIPLLIFITTLFLYHTYSFETANQAALRRDFQVFSVFWGTLAALFGIAAQGFISTTSALVLGIFFGALYTHLTPYIFPYLSALDPYWFFKWAQQVYNTGYVPEWDFMTYPYKGGILKHGEFIINNPDIPFNGSGLNFFHDSFFAPLLNAALALLLLPAGITLHDTAMLYPGVVGAFSVVLMYLLVKELFHEYEPQNRMAGVTAAFFLTFSPAFSTRAIAGNSEEDGLGMFFLIASFYFFARSLSKRCWKTALVSGLGFFTLTLTWSGFRYIIMVLGAASMLFAIIRFLKKQYACWHVPYFFISILPVFLVNFVILHEMGLNFPTRYFPGDESLIFSFLGGVFVPVILEALRRKFFLKEEIVDKEEFPNNWEKKISKNIIQLSLICTFIGLMAFIYMGPDAVINRFYQAAVLTKAQSVVGKTIAEQNPLAGDFSGFVDQGYNRFGISLYFGLFLMIFYMLYLAFINGSFGAVALLCWSVPMMWGVFNKSQFLFVSSSSIAALGATIGLLAAANKKELQGFRIIGTCMLLVVPIAYIPFFGEWNMQKFVGFAPMRMGPGMDRNYWEPALRWLEENTEETDAVLTWWDYGHWITSISHRPVLIDNLQADQFQIQDVAQFFVNKTTEEEAFEIVKTYDKAYQEFKDDQGRPRRVQYVTIDWSMIGKGSALHFIATGVIENETEGSFKNYAQCQFRPEISRLSPQMIMDETGNFQAVRNIVFSCQGYVGVIIFEIVSDDKGNIQQPRVKVRRAFYDSGNNRPYLGAEISWENWIKENDASLLGVQSPRDILTCAMSTGQPDQPYACRVPTFNTLVYVPEEFSDFMMTRLYLGQYLNEYKALGLYNREVQPLKHFQMAWDGLGRDGNLGTVKTWKIIYDEEDSPQESTNEGSVDDFYSSEE